MDGLKINDVTLFLGKIRGRKQECFYFVVGTYGCPVAYISPKILPEAQRFWQKMLDGIPVKESE